MDGLIIQVLNGSASPFEEERLKRWREEAPENEEYFQEMSNVWALTKPEPVAVTSGPPDVDMVLQAAGDFAEEFPRQAAFAADSTISKPLNVATKLRRPGGDKPSWARWGLLAASVAALAIGARVFLPAGPDPIAIYQPAPGQVGTYALEDGSFVRLADGAELKEWAVEEGREVSLSGKAFFAVARDENRPFVVKTAVGAVRVLGTRFQVESEKDSVETVVIEGLVRVSNEDGTVEVPAGNVARMVRGEGPTSESVPDAYELLGWPGGMLMFQGTPLSQVAQEVSRHYGRAIEITGPDLGNRQVTAWFQDEPFEAVTESLCLVTEALCTVDESGVTMGLRSRGGETR